MTSNPKEKQNTDDTKGAIAWLYDVSRSSRGWIILQVFFVSLTSLMSLIGAVFLKELVDAAVSKDSYHFWHWAIIAVLTILFEIICNSLSHYLRDITRSKISLSLRNRLFGNLLNKDFTAVRGKHSAEWLNRITLDTDIVAKALSELPPEIIGSTIRLVGALIILLRAIPWLVVFLILGAIAVALFGYIIKGPIKNRQRAVRETDGNQQAFIIENLFQLMIVKAFNREKLIEDNAYKLGDLVYEQQRKRALLYALVGSCKQIGMKGLYYITLIYSAYLILTEQLSYGTFIMISKLITSVRDPLIKASSYLTTYYELIVSVERLQESENFQADPDLPIKDDEEIFFFYKERFSEISLVDVGFVYKDILNADNSNPIVFSNVNISVPKHSCIAITGITGSGKSTLFKVLMSLYSIDEGKCILRTNTGEELTLDASFRRLFAYVPQGNQLMSGSIREMVTFGKGDDLGKTEEIRRALDLACASDFIDELPDGLDTVIKEKGLGLSEGQMQRLAIARAIFTERPILLLDEATSSLDEKTEEKLLNNLKSMSDKTILIVTHRPAALSICDYEIHIDGESVHMNKLEK